MIAALNEAQRIDPLLKLISEDPFAQTCDWLVLDGGGNRLSTSVRSLAVPKGVGPAVRKGWRYAINNGYDYSIRVDGDGQHLVSSTMALLEAARDGNGFSLGSRFNHAILDQTEVPIDRRLLNIAVSAVYHEVTRREDPDVLCGQFCLDRDNMEYFARETRCAGYGLTLEMLLISYFAGRDTPTRVQIPAVYASEGGEIQTKYAPAEASTRLLRAGEYIELAHDVLLRFTEGGTEW